MAPPPLPDCEPHSVSSSAEQTRRQRPAPGVEPACIPPSHRSNLVIHGLSELPDPVEIRHSVRRAAEKAASPEAAVRASPHRPLQAHWRRSGALIASDSDHITHAIGLFRDCIREQAANKWRSHDDARPHQTKHLPPFCRLPSIVAAAAGAMKSKACRSAASGTP